MKIKFIKLSCACLLISSIFIIGFSSHINTNVDKLSLLNRAVADDDVEQLQRTRGDIQLALGNGHSGAIVDGELYMWGYNGYGQLGIGNKDSINIPRKVRTPGTVTQLALGMMHSGAIIGDELYMWGYNANGQLGLGNNENKTAPTKVTTPGTVAQLALGDSYSGAIIGGELYMWGNNTSAQLGLGDKENKTVPTKVTTPGTVAQLALGDSHSGAIIDGELYMWGDNYYGKLGLGDKENKTTPTKVTTPGVVTELALGDSHSGAIIDGELYMWGENTTGQLGLGNSRDKNAPTKVEKIQTIEGTKTPITKGTITQLALGDNYSGAIIDGELYMWGYNYNGQLGLGDKEKQYTPTKVTKKSGGNTIDANSVTQLALGYNYSGAIIGGELYMWGNNSNGQLGFSGSGETIPTKVEWPLIINKDLHLNDMNDSDKKLRDNISYNIDADELKAFIKNSKVDIGIPRGDTFTISDTKSIGKVGADAGQISTQIFTLPSNTTINLTLKGFKPVNETQNITIPDNTIPNSVTEINKLEINKLVAQANANSSSDPSILTKWIIEHQNLFIGDTSVTNTIDFPQNTKITKVDNFVVVSGVDGTISFDIYVDKYYQKSGNDLIISGPSDPVIKLTKKLILTGLNKTNASIINQIDTPISNISGVKLLNEVFGYTDEATPISTNGLIELRKYVDLNSFSDDIVVRLIDLVITKSSLTFKLNIDKYYNEKGILITIPKTFDNIITFDNLLSSLSMPILLANYNKIPPAILLEYLEYETSDGSINHTKLDEYIDLTSFPNDAVFRLSNVSQATNNLTITITASTWYNENGLKVDTPKTYEPITISELPANPTTDIKLKTMYNNNILAGDLLKAFELNANNGSFDNSIVEQYVDFLMLVPGTTYTIDNLVNNNGVLSFTVIISKYYDNGKVVSEKKPFKIEIINLITTPNSKDSEFKKNKIDGDGYKLSQQIETEIKAGTVIAKASPTYELWNQLVNIDVYPPDTIFTINDITIDNKRIFSTFSIEFTSSNYYENNTNIIGNDIRTINIDNLEFTTTGIAAKPDFINYVNVSDFLSYIEYEETTGAFNVNRLQEFVVLNGVDVSEPGVSIKISDPIPNISENTINFDLEVSHYVDANGIGVNNPNKYSFNLNLNKPISDNSWMYDNLWWIITILMGGSVLLIILIISLTVIKENKKKWWDYLDESI